jgi:hypothetical protein
MKTQSIILSTILFVIIPTFSVHPQVQFSTHNITTNAYGAMSVYAIDLDSDKNIDVLSASALDDKITWYENLGPVGIVNYDQDNIPEKFKLYNNYPNPFNPETHIEFDVKRNSHVVLKIYDIQGREVITLVNELVLPNHYKVTFSGKDLASAIYFYQIRMGDFHALKKMTLTR